MNTSAMAAAISDAEIKAVISTLSCQSVRNVCAAACSRCRARGVASFDIIFMGAVIFDQVARFCNYNSRSEKDTITKIESLFSVDEKHLMRRSIGAKGVPQNLRCRSRSRRFARSESGAPLEAADSARKLRRTTQPSPFQPSRLSISLQLSR